MPEDSKQVVDWSGKWLVVKSFCRGQFLFAQVADFGLASTDGATIDSGKLPIKWTAPEVEHLNWDLKSCGHFCCCRLCGIPISPTNLTCGVLGCCSGRFTPLGECPTPEFPWGTL